MARSHNEEELDRLRRAVRLADLCRRKGILLQRPAPGDNTLVGPCPFHEDHEGCLVITPAKNRWECRGTCHRGGDVIEFVRALEKVSFQQAVDMLRRESGALPAPATLTTRTGWKHPVLIAPDAAPTDAALLACVAEFYHRTLQSTAKGLAYLKERAIFSPEAVSTFKLGYANRSLGYRVPATTAQGRALKEQLQRIGVLRPTGHEHFNGCVVFPIYDARGEVVEMYGRRLLCPVREAPAHWYLAGPRAGVWNAPGLTGQEEWLVCGSLVDALSLWVCGFRNVTASYGPFGFTPDHWHWLRQHRPRRILLCFGNHEAGNRGANELAQQLEPEGVEAWRVEFHPHTDVNDLVRGFGGMRAKEEDPRAALAARFAAARRLLPDSGPARPVVVPVSAPVPALTIPTSPSPVPREATADSSASRAFPATPSVPASTSSSDRTTAPVFEVLHDGQQAELRIGGRSYRVRGLDHNTSFDQLKVNLRVLYGEGAGQERFHVDTLDLYNARQRAAFLAAGQQILGVPRATLETDLAQLLLKLEAHQETQLLAKAKIAEPVNAGPKMSPEEEAKALSFLREPKLFQRLLADFELAGVVGEETNKLLGYLIAISRKLDQPLSARIAARSAAGKSALLNAILDFVPAEDKQVMTAMTGQALYYLPEDGLAHKVLAIVEEEGTSPASYPLKILQSEKELVLAVTVKDPDGGLPRTQLKRVRGPVAQFTTSTRSEADDEWENRSLILSVDEGRPQTQRILRAQRQEETLRGLLRDLDRQEILTTHHNAQRLLRPLRVHNPFAEALTFPDHRLRLRRDHKKYLGLIRATAFLRQYQKPVKSCQYKGQTLQYIEVDLEDVRLVHELTVQALGRSLDELAPPTRSFLLALHEMVTAMAREQQISAEAVRFSRRTVREKTGWSVTQVKEHLIRLLELEYVIVHRVPGLANRWEYELAWDGQGTEGNLFINGLAPLAKLATEAAGPTVGTVTPAVDLPGTTDFDGKNGPLTAKTPPLARR
jgi:DNA primase